MFEMSFKRGLHEELDKVGLSIQDEGWSIEDGALVIKHGRADYIDRNSPDFVDHGQVEYINDYPYLLALAKVARGEYTEDTRDFLTRRLYGLLTVFYSGPQGSYEEFKKSTRGRSPPELATHLARLETINDIRDDPRKLKEYFKIELIKKLTDNGITISEEQLEDYTWNYTVNDWINVLINPSLLREYF